MEALLAATPRQLRALTDTVASARAGKPCRCRCDKDGFVCASCRRVDAALTQAPLGGLLNDAWAASCLPQRGAASAAASAAAVREIVCAVRHAMSSATFQVKPDAVLSVPHLGLLRSHTDGHSTDSCTVQWA